MACAPCSHTLVHLCCVSLPWICASHWCLHLPDGCILLHLDAGRRYAFRQQPQVCYWNLLQLAAAFVRAEILEQVGLF